MPDKTYPDIGYPDIGYPDIGYPDIGYPDTDGCGKSPDEDSDWTIFGCPMSRYPMSGYLLSGTLKIIDGF